MNDARFRSARPTKAPWGLLVAALVLCLASVEAQSGPIEEARFISIGGIEQWITVRGDDRSSPVLLFLHGGPGDAQSSLASVYEPLEQDFVLVQWDQRGGGRTLAHAAGALQSTSLELLIQDGIELTEYVRSYLGTNNVILVGHSWGSFLGVHIAKRRPELFRAFVGTGQVVSWPAMVDAQYRYTLDQARLESNASAVSELEALGSPDPNNFAEYLVMRRWLNAYLAPSDTEWLTQQDALLSAALTADELMAYRRGFQTMTGLASTVFSIDVPSLGFDFELPFFLIQGDEDHITPTSMAAEYFEQVNAPTKRMASIDGAGHFAPTTHAQRFVAALKEAVALLR